MKSLGSLGPGRWIAAVALLAVAATAAPAGILKAEVGVAGMF